MTPQDTATTCLSIESHENEIQDPLMHYLGCINIRERDAFMERAGDSKNDITSELKRIEFLRKTLAKDKLDKHLVDSVIHSRKGVVESEIKRLIKEVESEFNSRTDLMEPQINSRRVWRDPPSNDGQQLTEGYDLPRDIRVPVIHFDTGDGQSLEDSRVWGTFPSQKTNLKCVLPDKSPIDNPNNNPDDNPNDNRPEHTHKKQRLFHKAASSSEITYVHIPYNNMIVGYTHAVPLRYLTNFSAVG